MSNNNKLILNSEGINVQCFCKESANIHHLLIVSKWGQNLEFCIFGIEKLYSFPCQLVSMEVWAESIVW